MPGQGIIGIIALLGIAWAFSENRKARPWRLVIGGLGVQLVLALILLKIPVFRDVFLSLNNVVLALQDATRAGTSFVFGYLGGGNLPFSESYPGASFVFAFQALPLILVISALSAVLFHWGILQKVVKGFAWVLQKSLGVGGAVGVSAAANVFVGMVEAPLFIRPYLKKLTRAELFIVMTTGMATIAGTMMVLYAGILSKIVPDAMGHILTASLINAPAAIVMASLLVPEKQDVSARSVEIEAPETKSTMDAITLGTQNGVKLLINIIAMLIVLVALVSLVNQLLSLLPEMAGGPITLQKVLGIIMAPVVWLMGVPWDEAMTAGALMGTKIILNEFLAYLDMSNMTADALSDKSRMIMTYALCGFANFGSLGIMVGGMAAMAPERRDDVVALGLKSILAGTLATCMSGAIAGLLY